MVSQGPQTHSAEHAFCQIGCEWNLSSDVLKNTACKLCASRTPDIDVNDLRFSLWRANKGFIESGQLPPCEDTLNQHAWRANYQSAIWRRSLEAKPTIPARRMAMDGGSTESGGTGGFCISWMTGLPVPDMILEFTSYKCCHVCQLPSCECMASRLKCTDKCSLRECSNMKEVIHWWNSRNRTKVMKMTVMRMMTSKLGHWTVVLTSTLEIHFF